jgi:hypothetical protein
VKARAKMKSPIRTEELSPQTAFKVSSPRRRSESSMTSSWTRVAVWSSSMEAAALTAAGLIRPQALQINRSRAGRSRLPRIWLRWAAIILIRATSLASDRSI